ncbi:mothers against decapentaplegic homolog 6-like isoform X1 [Leucoraja erinacea]|uniref:mothers against decapentaplegic homolog 6-like isoform X1 n=1 Tax=Leucoraja erinaceus TaxID=7782 RepID=UPI002454A11E|nr:mothers against decapentaplegic homolog 6-like isoform X1 [Leucoraja erinacea]
MFPSRRASAVRRLWRGRCQNGGLQGGLKPLTHSLFKRLREDQLEMLARAVEAGAAEDRVGCVSLARSGVNHWPQVLTCKLFRWPDLRWPHQLKHLSICDCSRRSVEDSGLVCCNPYHFSRLCDPESPPPPYSKLSPSKNQNNIDDFLEHNFAYDQGAIEPSNNSSDLWPDFGLGPHLSREAHWCSVAYWEHRTRVGRLYAVHEPSVGVFCDQPRGNGFCLGQLHVADRHEMVRRTRGKIGRGILLSREWDGVWAYNRSEHPVFVNSPTLGPPNSRRLSVHRVQPGYSVKIFDYHKARALQRTAILDFPDGPFDPNSIRISFAKGWGPCYSRQFITSCPCWLEILLNHS